MKSKEKIKNQIFKIDVKLSTMGTKLKKIGKEKKTRGKEFNNNNSRLRAKNFSFTYPEGISMEKVENKLKKIFPNAQMHNEEKSVIVSCKNYRNIYSLKHYSIDSKYPQIKTFSHRNLLRKNLIKYGHALLPDSIKSFLKSPTQYQCELIEKYLKNELEIIIKNMNLHFYSEYLIFYVFFDAIKNIGLENSENELHVLYFDQNTKNRMQKNLNDLNESFESCIILSFSDSLFIIKFVYDEENITDQKAKESNNKNYLKNLFFFLSKKCSYSSFQIKTVYKILIRFSTQNNINCSFKFTLV